MQGTALVRGWWPDPAELARRLAPHVKYPNGEGRATGYLAVDEWADVIAALENELGATFDTVVFQAYRDGHEVTPWHRDDYGRQAILSLGATRTFHLADDIFRVAAGDLVVMGREWHQIIADPDVTDERLSLVFRST